MTLQQLRDLEAVVHHGSFRAAARALRASQPGLTKSIGRLEATCGRRLVTRSPRGTLLTADGRAFMELASAVLRAAERADAWLQRTPDLKA